MKINALGYVGFTSPNYKTWKTFGPEVLGVSLAPEGKDGSVRLRMDERHHRIALHEGPSDELNYLGWEVSGRGAFDDALKHLDSKGVKYTEATPEELDNRRVVKMVWFLDPFKYRHEIYYGQQYIITPFIPGCPMNGFIAGDLGIGHCVLVVPEMTQELRDFATEVMCFTTYWPLGPTEIYRCNARSHCLVYLPIPCLRGIDHIYMEVKTIDDVGRALDRARTQNMVARDLGRFVQDEDVAFYLRTPTGVDIQYATGAKLVGDSDTLSNPAVMGSPLVWGHNVIIPGFGSTVHKVG
jgi:extradiol dioxygenase